VEVAADGATVRQARDRRGRRGRDCRERVVGPVHAQQLIATLRLWAAAAAADVSAARAVPAAAEHRLEQRLARRRAADRIALGVSATLALLALLAIVAQCTDRRLALLAIFLIAPPRFQQPLWDVGVPQEIVREISLEELVQPRWINAMQHPPQLHDLHAAIEPAVTPIEWFRELFLDVLSN
jgi:hypothetical protein